MKYFIVLILVLTSTCLKSEEDTKLTIHGYNVKEVKIKSISVNDRKHPVVSFVMDKVIENQCKDKVEYKLDTAIIREYTPNSLQLYSSILDAHSTGRKIKMIGLNQVCGRPNAEVVFIDTSYYQ